MEGDFNYKIGHLKFTQTELTWGKDKQLLKIYSDLSAKNPFKDEELKLVDIPILVEKYGLIEKFMGIVLIPKFNLFLLFSPLVLWNYYALGKIYIDQAANSLMKQVWTDFFFLNRDVVNKLMEFGGVLDLVSSTIQQKIKGNPEESQTSGLSQKPIS